MPKRLLGAGLDDGGQLVVTIDGFCCDHWTGHAAEYGLDKVPGRPLDGGFLTRTEALGRCKAPPLWSPAVYVPSKTPMADGHRQLRMMTKIHFCQAHAGELRIDDFLDGNRRAAFESHAKRGRPHDFRCDFDAAHIVYISIFAPEYGAFLLALQGGRDAVAQASRGGTLAAD
jgi:hypothetical protein